MCFLAMTHPRPLAREVDGYTGKSCQIVYIIVIIMRFLGLLAVTQLITLLIVASIHLQGAYHDARHELL